MNRTLISFCTGGLGVPRMRGDEPDPAEIWLTWVKTAEKTKLSRRYIGLYRIEEEKAAGFVVFDLLDDFWQGTTAFTPRSGEYLNRQRTGTLLYAKK